MTKAKKIWTTKFRKPVFVKGRQVVLRLDQSGGWRDVLGEPYIQLPSGQFIPAKEQVLEIARESLVEIPAYVKREVGAGFTTAEGVTYELQPKGENGALIPVPVGRVAKAISLSMGGSRVKVPAAAVRTK